jgi:signal transduction histidine kinase/ligand-binding sensor domain-containing protein
MQRALEFLAFALVVLACSPSALALNPALDVSQYTHTSWKIRDGFFKGPITSFAQLPDGYLLLGTELGLVRFDGVRFVPWQPTPNQPLPSNTILSLLVARDGTLWIGTDQGLASWKDRTLTRHEALAGSYIGRLAEDREGTIWLTRFATSWTLCSIDGVSPRSASREGGEKTRVTCYGEDGGSGDGALGVYEDRAGNLWVGTLTGVWRWKPGVRTFYRVPMAPNGIQGLSEASDGALLISTAGGIRRIVAGDAEMEHPFPSSTLHGTRLLRDRHGGLWAGTSTAGLVHMHDGLTDLFGRTDGLSGDYVTALFEDREGSIWVATMNGLDRFREAAVVTYSENQGLSSGRVRSVLASADGSVWIGTSDGLNRWSNGQMTVYRPRRAPRKAGGMAFTSRNVREINGAGMPDAVDAMLEASDHRVWLSTTGGVGFLENDRFIVVPGVPGGFVRGILEDSQKSLWFAYPKAGLFRVNRAARDVEQFGLDTLERNDPIMAVAGDPSGHGVWLGFFQGGVSYFGDGRVRTAYRAADGLADGRVSSLYTDPSGALWVAADGGLSRLKNGRIDTLTSRNGLPCDRVGWVSEDAARSLWLGTACGLVRIARPEIDAWTGATGRLRTTLFDQTDGVNSFINASFSSAVARSSDGKMWFISPDGVSVVDPDRLPVNTLQPPVHIEHMVADRTTYAATSDSGSPLRLPPLIRDLEINYTALSLVAPEKMQFRYKLENWDRDWQDVGTRRQAFYTDLPPGNYRFHVIASNNSGVWNETGASLNFSVAPAYYQTLWFRLLAIAAFVTLAAAAYQYRIRTVAHQLAMRLEARVEERTRIARDFHDTLLQSFQGVLLKFQAATYLLPNRPDEARKTLEAVIEQASLAISEGRDAVHGLRSSTLVTTDLAQAISLLGKQLSDDHGGVNPPGLRVEVEGTPRDLAPLVRDEVYRIAGEAMRNAFRHAAATRIEVDLHYDPRLFRLHVRDNGKGIDPSVLAAGGKKQHFGLRGMHERAHLVAGKLAVWSELNSGAEIELTIPGAVAYAKSSSAT